MVGISQFYLRSLCLFPHSQLCFGFLETLASLSGEVFGSILYIPSPRSPILCVFQLVCKTSCFSKHLSHGTRISLLIFEPLQFSLLFLYHLSQEFKCQRFWIAFWIQDSNHVSTFLCILLYHMCLFNHCLAFFFLHQVKDQLAGQCFGPVNSIVSPFQLR